MEKLVEEGLVKTIGISNFSVKKIDDLLQYAKITPAVNQVELHPYFRNEKLHKYCDSKVSAHAHCLHVMHSQLAETQLCQNSNASTVIACTDSLASHACSDRAWLQCAH